MSTRIEIIGVTASGKSTLIKRLRSQCEQLNLAICMEDLSPIDWIRRKWILDQTSHSTLLQCAYYMHRLQQLDSANSTGYPIISDFGLETDHWVYTTSMHELGYISQEDMQLLSSIYKRITPLSKPLSGLIYRRCPADKLIHRLIERGGYNREFDRMLDRLVYNAEKIAESSKYPIYVIDDDLTPEHINEALLFIKQQVF